jgi:hypothetical protein
MQELSENLMCIFTRQGIEIWLERKRAEGFIALLKAQNAPQFIEIAGTGNLVNRADITGIFTPQAMDDMKRRKNGEWQCKKGTWHERNQGCDCRSTENYAMPEMPDVSEEDRQRNIRALSELRKNLIH